MKCFVLIALALGSELATLQVAKSQGMNYRTLYLVIHGN